MDIAEPSPDKPSNPETKPRRRWLKFAAWASVGLALFLVLAASVVAVVLRSTQFHNYVLNALEKQASARLGTRVQVQNYTLHLRNLSADLYGLTVSGSAPYSSPPLLLVQHVEVGVRVVSVLHRKWYLDNLRIDRPILRVFVDGRGVSKIPPSAVAAATATTLFSTLPSAMRCWIKGRLITTAKKPRSRLTFMM